MTERLLQYIWQFQYYSRHELSTTAGEELLILHPGRYNKHQGPDFIEGRIKLQQHIWIGNIELHIRASDWQRHLHGSDRNYNNVILHVVWNNDVENTEYKFPTLVLGDRVPKLLLQQYEVWMRGEHFIPCESSAGFAGELTWISWKERLMVERLERKSDNVMSMLNRNNFHWEEVLWWMVARNFGLYVNADAFGEMAMSVPYNLLAKHQVQIHQLEALIFGQAGLLEENIDDKYAVMLQKEYHFLKAKYSLEKIHLPVHFLRMRPACFPTVRLAQLAILVHSTENIFSEIINAHAVEDIKKMLRVTANDYWHYHFRFGESSGYQPKTLGNDMINNIIMNTITVILFAYGKYHNSDSFQKKAIDWVCRLPGEHNSIIDKFRSLGVPVKNASDSQSLIELKSQYCDKRRCLDCAIGCSILNVNRQP